METMSCDCSRMQRSSIETNKSLKQWKNHKTAYETNQACKWRCTARITKYVSGETTSGSVENVDLWDEKAKFPVTMPEKPGNNTIMDSPISVVLDHPHPHKSNGSRNKSV
ncbi:hypothetical protein DKX38_009027 [Salix brachista]|uniref:Uncharacterized protein n=1 Tax=Salix brachista TaxID=2182728 RepID=A0A5N5MCA2_9ROSI|nr:hypothetical protein DKX38_009027 [Salix brachista]